MERKYKWVQRSPEWIKEHPKQGTMYKVYEDGEEATPQIKPKVNKRPFTPDIKGNEDAGVYVIVCAGAKRAYVGQSINMGSRMRNHKMVIVDKSQPMQSKMYIDMRDDWKTFGEDGFEFIKYKPMPGCNSAQLIDVENSVMVEYAQRGYSLYNKVVSLGANLVFVQDEHIDIIKSLVNLLTEDKTIADKIQALIH